MSNRATDGWQAAFLRLLPDIVDDRTGLIKTVYESPVTPGAPSFSHIYALASNTRAFCRQTNFAHAGGASTDPVTATAKAVGEAIERYCSAVYDREEMPNCSAREADFPCVDPASFALLTPAQCAADSVFYVPFTDETPVRWTECWDATEGKPIWAPAGLVYVPYFYHTENGACDAPIAQPISTGLACHTGYAQAALGAICEVVERDALMLMWQAMISPPRISPETLSDANYDRVERFAAAQLDDTLFDITTDLGVPTILSVIRTELPEESAFVMAAATDPDPEVAARKSLEELAHTRRFSHMIKQEAIERGLGQLSDDEFSVKEQHDHLRYWAFQERLPACDFLFASEKRIEFSDVAPLGSPDGTPVEKLGRVIDRLRDAGHKTVVCDITTPDVAEVGFCVVRAIVPGLHPMFMGYDIRALGGRRLWEAPQRMGYPGVTPEGGDNPHPHPYP